MGLARLTVTPKTMVSHQAPTPTTLLLQFDSALVSATVRQCTRLV